MNKGEDGFDQWRHKKGHAEVAKVPFHVCCCRQGRIRMRRADSSAGRLWKTVAFKGYAEVASIIRRRGESECKCSGSNGGGISEKLPSCCQSAGVQMLMRRKFRRPAMTALMPICGQVKRPMPKLRNSMLDCGRAEFKSVNNKAGRIHGFDSGARQHAEVAKVLLDRGGPYVCCE